MMLGLWHDFGLLHISFFISAMIFSMAIYDAYLQSPIVQNVEIVPNNIGRQAKRAVLIVCNSSLWYILFNGKIIADGLRSDVAYEGFGGEIKENIRLKYLNGLLKERDDIICGISLSQAPTESRAAHTAMLAGFWEDLANLRKRIN